MIMKPYRPALTLEELLAFLKTRGKLASYKMPSILYLWHEAQLPRGATGKTVKKDIRKYYVEQVLAKAPASKL